MKKRVARGPVDPTAHPLPTMNFAVVAPLLPKTKKKGPSATAPVTSDAPVRRTRSTTPAVDPAPAKSSFTPVAKRKHKPPGPSALEQINEDEAIESPSDAEDTEPPRARKAANERPYATAKPAKPTKPAGKPAVRPAALPVDGGEDVDLPATRARNGTNGRPDAVEKPAVKPKPATKPTTKPAAPPVGGGEDTEHEDQLEGDEHEDQLEGDEQVLPPTPIAHSPRHLSLFDPDEQAFLDAEVEELQDTGADQNEEEEALVGFGQPRSPFYRASMPRSSPPPSSSDVTDTDSPAHKAKTKAKGKGRYKSPTPASSVDDGTDDEEDPEASTSFIDASSRTRLSLPSTNVVLASARGNEDNFPTSPIHASVLRKTTKPTNGKRKRVEFEEVEQMAVAGPSRQPSDVLAAHKKKKARSNPNPEVLSAVALRLDGAHHTPDRRLVSTPRRSTPGRSPATPGNGKKRRNRKPGKGAAYQLKSYTPRMRDVLVYGKDRYKMRVIAEDAFPGDALRTKFGKESFAQARDTKAEQFQGSSNQTFDSAKLRVLADTSWGLRGAVKTLAVTQVVTGYNLEQPRILGVARTAATVRAAHVWTKERVEALLLDGNFITGPHNNLPDVRYMNQNISTLIRAAIGVFGPEIQTVFTPMPHATVALAATCLEMALKQWSTGRVVPVPIGRADEKVYRRHMKRMVDLQRAKPNRYKNLMHVISIDTFFYDNEVPEDEVDDAEEDTLKLFGADSEDDEPAFD